MTVSERGLTTGEVIAAVAQLDGIRLPQRTLAGWLASGLVTASLRWVDKAPRSGFKARGRYNACLFSPDDLAQIRRLVRRRYFLRHDFAELLAIVRELSAAFDDGLNFVGGITPELIARARTVLARCGDEARQGCDAQVCATKQI